MMVMLAEPEAAAFSDLVALMVVGFNDHSSVDVANFVPADTDTRRLPPNPVPVRHRTCVSDTHSVLPQVVKLRAIRLKSSDPKFEPRSVMLTDPVAWRFVCHA